MRKHFLLLFLLTLLPLAGWATDYSVYVNAKAISITYGTANPAANAVNVGMFTANLVGTGAGVDGAVKEAIAGKLTFATERVATSPVSGSYTFTLALADVTDNTVTVSGDDYTILLQEATNDLVVTKADGAVVDVVPVLVTGALSFTNAEQDLLSNYGSGKIDGTTVTGLPLEYSYDDGANWRDDTKFTDAGTYTIKYRVKETDNYTASAAAVLDNKVVAKATPVVTAPGLVSPLTYTGLGQEVISTPSKATFGATVTYRLQKWNGTGWDTAGPANTDPTAIKATNAGTYRVRAYVVESTNYNTVEAYTDEFTVAKASLTIAIKTGQSKEYALPANADPTLVYEYTGLLNNEDPADLIAAGDLVVSGMTRVAGENAGVYPITIDDVDAFTAKNYEITVNSISRNFSITSKALAEVGFTFTVDPAASKVFTGEGIEPGLSVAKYGANDLTLGTDFTLSYSNNTNVGTDAAVMTITGKGNFKGTLTRNFSITKKNIYIRPVNATKVYGTGDPEFTWELYTSPTSTAAADKVDNSVLGGTVELARVPGANVGTYKIYVKNYTLATEDQDNYKVDNVLNDVNSDDAKNITATFTITAPTEGLVLKFKEGSTAEKVYGDDDPAWTINDLEVESGLASTDTWDDVKASLGTPVFALESQNAGPTQVNVTNLASPVYPSVTVTPMDFTVNKRPIAVVVNPQEVAYGVAVASTTANWEMRVGVTESKGLANNVGLGITDTQASVDLTVKTAELIGTYAPGSVTENAIIAEIASTSNYVLLTDAEVTSVDKANTWGTLTITAAPGTLSLDDSQTNLVEQLTAFNGQALASVLIKFGERSNHKYSEDPADTDTYPCEPEKWTTMVLPFDISVADLSKALGYAIVNVINPSRTEVSGTGSKFYGKLTMTGGNDYVDADPEKNDTKLAANKPFMLKLADGINPAVYYDFGAQTIKAPTALSVDAGGDCTFVGTYAAKKVTKDDEAAIWFMNGNEDGWQYINSTSSAVWTILPFEAYIDMSAVPTPARNMTFYAEDVDGTVTAINGVTNEVLGTKLNAEGWYTINGMKLQSAPIEKGVYINNGKKIVIK
jgi:hypothetical protein